MNASQPSNSPALALYVHWPFCVSKCPYCDFNSHVRDVVDQDAWRKALLADLAHEAALLPGRRLGSIFFGGGTPSLMPPETVAAVIDAATAAWAPVGDIEITLEANPSSVEAARVASWEAELGRALSFGTEHLSLYQLTIEPGTRFATLAAKGELRIPDDDTAADLWEVTQSLTAAAGLLRYEVSNHARPGAESRHNLAYWRYTDYAGVGPGAHGRRGGLATLRHKKPENWLAAVQRNGHGMQEETPLTVAERATEALVMGLRLAGGIDLAGIDPLYIDSAAVIRLEAHGLIASAPDHLRVTAEGMPVLEAILREVVRT